MVIFLEGGVVPYVTVGNFTRAIVTTKDPVIYVFINSGGGCFESGLYLYDLLKNLQASGKKVITYALGEIVSTASLVYVAGDERYANEHSVFHLHEVTLEDTGDQTATDSKRTAASLEQDSDTWFGIIAAESKLTKAKIKREIAKNPEWKFDAALAKKFGIVHKIGMPTIKQGEQIVTIYSTMKDA